MHRTLPRRAYLGAELGSDADSFGPHGLTITGVREETMAAHADLRAGDVIVTIADAPVRSLAELGAALRRAGAQDEVAIRFLRGADEHVVTVAAARVPVEDGVELDALAVDGGCLRLLRTRAPRAHDTTRRAARIVFVQGIACESIDHALAPEAPLAGLVEGWTRAGFDTVRFDKRGIGDSEGSPCTDTDFATELADAGAVVAAAAREPRPLILCGHSVGGIIVALLASEQPVAGVIVYGTPVMRWLACLQDSARRQLVLRGATPEMIAERVEALARLAEQGELNGRSAAYHRQLDALDLEAAWRRVRAPILVVRGEHDWVVDVDDQARIAELAAGPVTIVDVPGLDHLLGRHADRDASLRDYGDGAFDRAIVDATLEWLRNLEVQG